jgi:hypothetical protein
MRLPGRIPPGGSGAEVPEKRLPAAREPRVLDKVRQERGEGEAAGFRKLERAGLDCEREDNPDARGCALFAAIRGR